MRPLRVGRRQAMNTEDRSAGRASALQAEDRRLDPRHPPPLIFCRPSSIGRATDL